MTTGTILVQDALAQKGVIAENVAPSANQLAAGLRWLNRMLDSWEAEKAMIYTKYNETLTLAAGTAGYTTAQFASGNGRPSGVDSIVLTLSNVTYPVTMIDNQTYNQITFKSTTAVPTMCYYDAAFPTANFNFYPTPYAAFTASVAVLYPISSAITATTNVVLPPGFEKAIVDNLVVYMNYGIPPTAQMIKDANDSRAILKRMNYQPLRMSPGFGRNYSVSNDFPYRGF